MNYDYLAECAIQFNEWTWTRTHIITTIMIIVSHWMKNNVNRLCTNIFLLFRFFFESEVRRLLMSFVLHTKMNTNKMCVKQRILCMHRVCKLCTLRTSIVQFPMFNFFFFLYKWDIMAKCTQFNQAFYSLSITLINNNNNCHTRQSAISILELNVFCLLYARTINYLSTFNIKSIILILLNAQFLRLVD